MEVLSVSVEPDDGLAEFLLSEDTTAPFELGLVRGGSALPRVSGASSGVMSTLTYPESSSGSVGPMTGHLSGNATRLGASIDFTAHYNMLHAVPESATVTPIHGPTPVSASGKAAMAGSGGGSGGESAAVAGALASLHASKPSATDGILFSPMVIMDNYDGGPSLPTSVSPGGSIMVSAGDAADDALRPGDSNEADLLAAISPNSSIDGSKRQYSTAATAASVIHDRMGTDDFTGFVGFEPGSIGPPTVSDGRLVTVNERVEMLEKANDTLRQMLVEKEKIIEYLLFHLSCFESSAAKDETRVRALEKCFEAQFTDSQHRFIVDMIAENMRLEHAMSEMLDGWERDRQMIVAEAEANASAKWTSAEATKRKQEESAADVVQAGLDSSADPDQVGFGGMLGSSSSTMMKDSLVEVAKESPVIQTEDILNVGTSADVPPASLTDDHSVNKVTLGVDDEKVTEPSPTTLAAFGKFGSDPLSLAATTATAVPNAGLFEFGLITSSDVRASKSATLSQNGDTHAFDWGFGVETPKASASTSTLKNDADELYQPLSGSGEKNRSGSINWTSFLNWQSEHKSRGSSLGSLGLSALIEEMKNDQSGWARKDTLTNWAELPLTEEWVTGNLLTSSGNDDWGWDWSAPKEKDPAAMDAGPAADASGVGDAETGSSGMLKSDIKDSADRPSATASSGGTGRRGSVEVDDEAGSSSVASSVSAEKIESQRKNDGSAEDDNDGNDDVEVEDKDEHGQQQSVEINELRIELARIAQSKVELIVSTAAEIERLRKYISRIEGLALAAGLDISQARRSEV